MFVILQISSFRPFKAYSDQSNRRRQYPEFLDRFYNKGASAYRPKRKEYRVLKTFNFFIFRTYRDQINRHRQYPEFPDHILKKGASANQHERTKFKVSNY